LTSDRHEIDLGPIAAWAPGDDQRPPVTDPGDTPDDRFRDILTWLFLPSIVGALSVWVLLHAWFNLSTGYGWAFIGIDLVIYMLIGWRGRRLFLFVSRLVRRNS